MKVLPHFDGMAQKVVGITKKFENEVVSSPNAIGFCSSDTLSILIVVKQMEQARNADKQNDLNHDERCREVKKTVRESEGKVILAIKKKVAQPIKNFKELMKIYDQQ